MPPDQPGPTGLDNPPSPPTNDKEWDDASPMQTQSNVTDLTKHPRPTRTPRNAAAPKEDVKAKAEAAFKTSEKRAKPEATGEDQTPRILSNIGNPRLFAVIGKLRAATAKKDEAVSKIRSIRKEAKADGINLTLMDQVMREMRMSPDELISENNLLNEYRAQVRLPAYEPLDLEGAKPRTSEEQLDYIELEGERAGLRGANAGDCPHEIDSEPGARWMAGYDKGQAMLRGQLKATMERNNKAKEAKADDASETAPETSE